MTPTLEQLEPRLALHGTLWDVQMLGASRDDALHCLLEGCQLAPASLPHQDNPEQQAEHLYLFSLFPVSQANGTSRILIPFGATMTVAESISAEWIRVQGTLEIRPGAEIRVDTIVTDPGSILDVSGGTVTFIGGPLRADDPLQMSRGLIAHGTVNIHGEPKTPFIDLGDPIPSDWADSDRLVIPGEGGDNELTVAELGSPLEYLPTAHPVVANLTRSIVFESENPQGTRGHVMMMHNASRVEIGYAEFRDLGRTRADVVVTDPKVDGSGGDNVRGRYACFSGETKFWTYDGLKTFAECAGTSQKVFSTGRTWEDAWIRSFGKQHLQKLTVRRNGVEKVIYTTEDHRWLIRKRDNDPRNGETVEVLTKNLKEGHRLAFCFPGSRAIRATPSAFGIAAGIVFGDGYEHDGGSQVTLWEHKQELLRYYPLSTHAPESRDTGIQGTRVTGLPKQFKHLPSRDESTAYLFGWLVGYFATDGHVTEQGCVSLSSTTKEHMEFVQDICTTRLGIATYGISVYEKHGGYKDATEYRLKFIKELVPEEMLVLSKHAERFASSDKGCKDDKKSWTVVSVEDGDRYEDVYCATVPSTGTFTLEGNILTGNCHFHRGGTTGEPATVTGIVVTDALKLGIVNHASNVIVDQSIVYGFDGSAFFTETGNELGAFTNNLAIRSHSPLHAGFEHILFDRRAAQDFGFTGVGEWFQGPGVTSDGFKAYNVNTGIMMLTEPLFENGQRVTLNGQSIDALPVQWHDTTVVNAKLGVFINSLGSLGAPIGNDHDINGLELINVVDGIAFAYTSGVHVQNVRAVGTMTGSGYAGNGVEDKILISDSSFSNYRVGARPPYINGGDPFSDYELRLERVHLNNHVGVAYLAANRPLATPVRTQLIDVTFGTLPTPPRPTGYWDWPPFLEGRQYETWTEAYP